MSGEDFLWEALQAPEAAIGYGISRHLAALYPERAVLEGNDCSFNVEEFAAGGQCALQRRPAFHARILTGWLGAGEGLWRQAEHGWFSVSWDGHALDLLLVSWSEGLHKGRSYWVLAETAEIAERFFLTVCEWCAEVRGEVLVYDGGHWHKSKELYHAIQGTTFANLVLHGGLKEEIREDLGQFFGARETYQEYSVPWKRGILFIGPAGNGKTHTVKAVINALGQPCLYVKSFRSEFQTDHDSMRQVFHRARQTTPCLLVLEDLDSLLDGGNRAFFLNELDGFAANEGIVTLATTNHPERLDPSILNRPSRFDRKYHFPIPGPGERAAYLRLWNSDLKFALRLSENQIEEMVALTEEFSYAYIKELFLSSIMRWIAAPDPGGMAAVMREQATSLREQMVSGADERAEEFSVDEDAVSPEAAMRAMMRFRRGRHGFRPRPPG
jgi:hypothetical protein